MAGSNLTDDIRITPPVGYELAIETTTGSGNPGTFNTGPLTLARTGGTTPSPTIAATRVFVRLASTTTVAGSPYNGNLVHTSTGATQVDKPVNGTVTAPVPVPTITSFTPGNGPVGTSVIITGTNFTGATAVAFNGTAATSFTVNSGTQITATVPATATTGTITVTTPGGTATSATTFVVDPTPNPVPTISSLNPATIAAGSLGFTLAVEGTGFATGATVSFNGTPRTTSFVSATRLTATILASDVATAGTYNVIVTNPTPAGGASAAAQFTVTPSVATSTLLLYTFNGTTVTPDAPPASNANVTGSNFDKGTGLGRTGTTGAYIVSGLNNNGRTTPDPAEYVGFSITPNASSQVSLSELSFKDQVSIAAGPSSTQVQYSLSSTFTNPVVLGTQAISVNITTRTIDLRSVTALQNVTGTVYFRIYPYGGTNGSATYRIDDVQLDGTVAAAPSLVFYSKPTGDLNTLATFGNNTDGSGTAPSSFSAGNSTYNITGTNRTISSAWTVSGTGSKVVLTPGASFTVPVTANFTGTIDLEGTAYLTVENLSPSLTLGELSTNSTVEYAQASGTYTVPAADNGYGNLKLTNATKRFATSDTYVFGNLLIDNVTGVGGSSTSSFSTVVLYGNLSLLGTTTFDPASARRVTLELSGTSAQTLAGNGNTLRLFRLTTTESGAGGILSDANGGTPVEVGNSSSNGGGVDLTPGSTLALNSNTFSFTPGGNAVISNTGSFTLSPGSSLDFESANNNTFIGSLYITPGASTLNNLRISHPSGDFLDVSESLTVNGVLNLDGTGVIEIGPNQTLTLNGTVIGTGRIRGAATSDIVIGGTGALGTLRFTSSAGTQQVRNFTINRANSGTVELGSPLVITNNLNLNGGKIITTATNSLTLRNSVTTQVNTGGTSFVDGPLIRQTNAITAPAQFVFPIGKDGVYRPATLNISSQTSATAYTAELFNTSARTTSVQAPLERVSAFRYVSVTPDAQPTGFTGTITLSFGEDDEVNNPAATSLVVAKRSTPTDPWASISRTGNSGSANGTSFVPGTLTSDVFTSFSDFALASTDPDRTNNPLPVELLSFTAERQSEVVRVAWATASEKNNARFEVQRSADGKDFRTLATVAGQGTTTRRHDYAELDRQPLASLAYYRLRQIDQDGKASFSPVVTVAPGKELAVYPNPTRAALTVVAPAPAASYRVLSMVGSVVLEGQAPSGTTTLDVAKLPAGLYQLEVTSAAGRVVRKFTKLD